ncbi:MAG: universal stress protein [Alphaproteobacteria bacterium]|nr:universal stress protein [Alphaproteobacteria bacterium]
MTIIRTILVPIDVAKAEAGAAALGLARDLAEKYGSKLILLHVLEEVPGFVKAQLPAGIHAKALEDAAAGINAFAAKHGLAGTAEVLLREGNPSVQILELAKKISADMIVIASHDPGVADYFLGSVAARVVRHAHCSVLVARKL